jgi:hypothetical protein
MMRNRFKRVASSMLRRAMAGLLALSLLGALSPAAAAFAFAAAQADAAHECCTPRAAFCKGPGATAALEHAQTAPVAGAVASGDWRDCLAPLTEASALQRVPLAPSGPPAYLRFHRFLL